MTSRESPETEGLRLRWPIADDYFVKDGFLWWSGGEALNYYEPQDYPQIALHLAELRGAGEDALVAFARNWGHLGFDALRGHVPEGQGPHAGDPIPWIWAHADTVALCRDLITHLRRKGDKGLARYLDSRLQSAPQFPPGHELYEQEKGKHLVLLLANRDRTEIQFWDTGRLSNPRRCASDILQTAINPNLLGLHPQIKYNDALTRLGVRFPSGPLIQIAYWHLARMAEGAFEVATCQYEKCGKPFVRTDGRQVYCPPDSRDKTKKGESRCSRRARARRQRARNGKKGA